MSAWVTRESVSERHPLFSVLPSKQTWKLITCHHIRVTPGIGHHYPCLNDSVRLPQSHSATTLPFLQGIDHTAAKAMLSIPHLIVSLEAQSSLVVLMSSKQKPYPHNG